VRCPIILRSSSENMPAICAIAPDSYRVLSSWPLIKHAHTFASSG